MTLRMDGRTAGLAILFATSIPLVPALAGSTQQPASCGATLHLKKGEKRGIELPAKGSAGYLWQPSSKAAPTNVALSRGGQLVNKGTGGAEDVVQIFEVTGATSGNSELVLELVKPSERGADPLATCSIPVVVE